MQTASLSRTGENSAAFTKFLFSWCCDFTPNADEHIGTGRLRLAQVDVPNAGSASAIIKSAEVLARDGHYEMCFVLHSSDFGAEQSEVMVPVALYKSKQRCDEDWKTVRHLPRLHGLVVRVGDVYAK